VYYSNGQDLKYELGHRNELLQGYSYNSYHQVLTATNAVGDRTVYNYDTQRRLSSKELPTHLTNNYTFGADGFISQITDQPIRRTESFTYPNSPLATH